MTHALVPAPPGSSSLLGPVLWLGSARAAQIAARAVLFLALGLALPPNVFGVVAILFALAAAANLLLELGTGPWLMRQGAIAAERVVPALGGLVLLRLALVPGVLALYLCVSRVLIGPEMDWGLATSVGLFHLLLQVCQTLFAVMRGADRQGLESLASLTLHGLELAVLGVWVSASAHPPGRLFLALGALRLLALVALLAAAARMHGATFDVGAGWALLRENVGALKGFALLSLAQYVITQADVLLLKLWGDVEGAGRYWACYRLLQNILLPVDLLLLAAMPRLASARDVAARNVVYNWVHSLAGAWTLCALALVTVQSDWIARSLLHDGFSDTGPLLALLGFAVAILYLPPFGIGIAMSEPPGVLLRAYGPAAVLNLALNIALIPSLGVWGAAASALVTHLVLKAIFVHAFRARGLLPWPGGNLWPAIAAVGGWAIFALTLEVPPSVALLLLAAVSGAVLVHATGVVGRGTVS